MISPVELRRLLAEWRLRLTRVKDILQPPTWNEQEWRQFSQALALMVRDHGRSWIIDPNIYWDLRWNLQDGAELVCQIEHIPGEKTSLVVAQNGGFAAEVGSYTWLWAEFNLEGNFARDPYWVEGTWKDALTTLLLPLDRQASYLLAGRAQTPDSLLLQDGARPNDQNYRALLPGISESSRETYAGPDYAGPDENIIEMTDEPAAATQPDPEPEKPYSEVAVDLRATVQSVAAVYDRRTDLPSSEAAVGPADGSNPRALPSEVAVDPPNEAAVYDRRTDLPSSEAAVGPADGSNPRALPSEVAVDLRATGDKNYSSGGPVTDAPAIRAEDNTAIIPEPTPSPAPEAQETVPAEPVTEQSAPPHSETANGNTSAHPSPRIDTPETFAIRWGMPQKLTWKDADEIAYALIDAHPDQDPLKLSFPKLHKLIIELADFGDDPEKSTESILESIQMAWYEEVK